MVREGVKERLAFVKVVPVGSVDALDETRFAEDVLRGAAGGFGDGEAVAAAGGVGGALGDQLAGNAPSAELFGHAQEIEMGRLARGGGRASGFVGGLQAAEQVENRFVLGAEVAYAVRHGGAGVFGEEDAGEFAAAGGPGDDREALLDRVGGEERDEPLEVRRGEPEGEGDGIALGEGEAEEVDHLRHVRFAEQTEVDAVNGREGAHPVQDTPGRCYAGASPMGESQKDVNASQIWLYFGLLSLLVNLVNPTFLLDIPTSYMLKNRLQASPAEIASFRLVTAIPLFLGFGFGLARDLWSPLGRRDLGYFRIFVPLMSGALAWMAFSPVSHSGLLAGMLMTTIAYGFIAAAAQGLTALIGQEAQMTGRLSALSNFFLLLPAGAAYFASGYMAESLTPRQVFLLVLALTATLAVFG